MNLCSETSINRFPILNSVFFNQTISSFCISLTRGSFYDPVLEETIEVERFLNFQYISGSQNFWYFHESSNSILAFPEDEFPDQKRNPFKFLELNKNLFIDSSSSIFSTRFFCSSEDFYSTSTISSYRSKDVSNAFPGRMAIACWELSQLIE